VRVQLLLGALLIDVTGPIPEEIIDFLIRMYADDEGLRWAVADLASVARSRRMRMTGGFHVEWSSVAALYVTTRETLVINSVVRTDMRSVVIDILHEIQHYNQHMRWANMSHRDRFVRGKKLPASVKDDPIMLYEMDWQDMMDFWERTYGYKNSPHEKDARAFAEKTVDEAMGFIEQHFGRSEE
jgi:hypothetical protein